MVRKHSIAGEFEKQWPNTSVGRELKIGEYLDSNVSGINASSESSLVLSKGLKQFPIQSALILRFWG